MYGQQNVKTKKYRSSENENVLQHGLQSDRQVPIIFNVSHYLCTLSQFIKIQLNTFH